MPEKKEEAFIESPKLCPGTFLLIFGQSQSGKSSFLKVKNWKKEMNFE